MVCLLLLGLNATDIADPSCVEACQLAYERLSLSERRQYGGKFKAALHQLMAQASNTEGAESPPFEEILSQIERIDREVEMVSKKRCAQLQTEADHVYREFAELMNFMESRTSKFDLLAS